MVSSALPASGEGRSWGNSKDGGVPATATASDVLSPRQFNLAALHELQVFGKDLAAWCELEQFDHYVRGLHVLVDIGREGVAIGKIDRTPRCPPSSAPSLYLFITANTLISLSASVSVSLFRSLSRVAVGARGWAPSPPLSFTCVYFYILYLCGVISPLSLSVSPFPLTVAEVVTHNH